jgi:hypothetical protein
VYIFITIFYHFSESLAFSQKITIAAFLIHDHSRIFTRTRFESSPPNKKYLGISTIHNVLRFGGSDRYQIAKLLRSISFYKLHSKHTKILTIDEISFHRMMSTYMYVACRCLTRIVIRVCR